MNLSFHAPKKDQCSLCTTYREGSQSTKLELAERFQKHTQEKIKVRELKEDSKSRVVNDSTFLCASFDLQQVIYLPKSNESALFYKRRLANFNFTFYNIASKDCFCYTWHEGLSKRGANEIATCVFKALDFYNSTGIKNVSLYSDGCTGQNKNSIMATMLLYVVASCVNIEEISLRFFESFHGQNEGDSAHSAISYAIKQGGDLFVPSQLSPVFKLARRNQPYLVHCLRHDDILDFKELSKTLRVLSVKVADTGEAIRWTDVMEIKVQKQNLHQIFLKTSHLQKDYVVLSLKRQKNDNNIRSLKLAPQNYEPNKISKEKYLDLNSLCRGDTPIIKLSEHQDFYKLLPHAE